MSSQIRVCAAAFAVAPLSACQTLSPDGGMSTDDYRDPSWYKHPPGTVAYAADADPNSAPTAPAMPEDHMHHH